MNSYYSNNNQQQQQYQGRREVFQQQQPEQRAERAVDTTLLPNEVRISMQGNFNSYVKTVFYLLTTQGYSNCKLVGRGGAATVADELQQYLQSKAPQFTYESYLAKSFNKRGDVVDELHVMIGVVEHPPQVKQQQYHQERYPV